MVGLRLKLRQRKPAPRPKPKLQPAYVAPARNRLYVADALSFARGLPDDYLDCIITSPPYFNLRDYGQPGQWGNEDTIEDYVGRMVELLRECRRALKDTGTLWLNLGDSYGRGTRGGNVNDTLRATNIHAKGQMYGKSPVLPPKNLLGIPWRVALALQSDGWILRSDIIWHKPNPMPESVTDRCTVSHEYVFMLTKQPRYWYDGDAIREAHTDKTVHINKGTRGNQGYSNASGLNHHPQRDSSGGLGKHPSSRNKRTVWTIPTIPFPGAHFAVFPPALIEPMVLAGCPRDVCAACGQPHERVVERVEGEHETTTRPKQTGGMSSPTSTLSLSGNGSVEWTLRGGKRKTKGFTPTCDCAAATNRGLVFDPFSGAGTTALVARYHRRDYIGCDLNAEYVDMARGRLIQPYNPKSLQPTEYLGDLPLFKATVEE